MAQFKVDGHFAWLLENCTVEVIMFQLLAGLVTGFIGGLFAYASSCAAALGHQDMRYARKHGELVSCMQQLRACRLPERE
jgi:hypothetical protein